jgi:thymidylate synthase (FAD)
MWQAMHQDYSSEPVNSLGKDETIAGQIAVERLLAGGRGHFGVAEHPQISINCCYFPHSVMQQARTHRVGVTFDVQSFRYTGDKLKEIESFEDLEKVIYFRPVGEYKSRTGDKFNYTADLRHEDVKEAYQAVLRYNHKVQILGFSEEHARSMLPFDYRQHFVVSFNARSLMHFLDLRCKADAQIEIQWLADDLFTIFQQWMPEIAGWYETNRLRRAKLAP